MAKGIFDQKKEYNRKPETAKIVEKQPKCIDSFGREVKFHRNNVVIRVAFTPEEWEYMYEIKDSIDKIAGINIYKSHIIKDLLFNSYKRCPKCDTLYYVFSGLCLECGEFYPVKTDTAYVGRAVKHSTLKKGNRKYSLQPKTN